MLLWLEVIRPPSSHRVLVTTSRGPKYISSAGIDLRADVKVPGAAEYVSRMWSSDGRFPQEHTADQHAFREQHCAQRKDVRSISLIGPRHAEHK
jgi:hypothetical protein